MDRSPVNQQAHQGRTNVRPDSNHGSLHGQTINLPARHVRSESIPIPTELVPQSPSLPGRPSELVHTALGPNNARKQQSSSARSDDREGSGWVLTLVGLLSVAILYSSFAFRDQVTTVLPDLAGFYNAMGIKTAAKALEIEGFVAERQAAGKNERVTITGMVRNSSSATLAVPALQVAIGGKPDAALRTVHIALSNSHIKAGESLPFSFDLQPVSRDDTSVLVSLSPIAE